MFFSMVWKYFLPNYDFENIFCHLGWQDSPLFPLLRGGGLQNSDRLISKVLKHLILGTKSVIYVWKMLSFKRGWGEGAGVIQILTFADRGEGVKNGLKYADVIIAWSLIPPALGLCGIFLGNQEENIPWIEPLTTKFWLLDLI